MAFTVSIALIAGYAMVWTGFGVLAFVGDVGLHKLVHAWPWLAAHPQLIAGSVLALAGAFQFSELKERCLTECRHRVRSWFSTTDAARLRPSGSAGSTGCSVSDVVGH